MNALHFVADVTAEHSLSGNVMPIVMETNRHAEKSRTNCKVFIEMFIEIYFFLNIFSAITNLILCQLYYMYNVENSLDILNIAYTNPNQKLKNKFCYN